MDPQHKPAATNLAQLQEIWRTARRDKSPGAPADEVMDRLERKYQAIADARKSNAD